MDFTKAVMHMYNEGAYARAAGMVVDLKNGKGFSIVILRWRPRLERNENGRYN